MKSILLILNLLFFSFVANAQNAYYDALFCSSLVSKDLDSNASGLTSGERQLFFEGSKFLNDPFNNPKPDFVRIKQALNRLKLLGDGTINPESFGPVELAGLATSILGLSKPSAGRIDSITYGVTTYFADEFKRGYLETYLRLFDHSIGQNGELQVLFPQTYQKLRTFDPARYKKLGDELKGVFDEDLAASFDNLVKHMESNDPIRFQDKKFLLLNRTVCEAIRKKPYFLYAKMSGDIAQKLIKGVHPSDVFGHLDENYSEVAKLNPSFSSFYQKLHLLNILQRNLRDTTKVKDDKISNVWINFEKLSKLDTPKKKFYFLALLFQEEQSSFRELSTSLTGITSQSLTTLTSPSIDKINITFKNVKTGQIGKLLSVLIKIDEYSRLKGKKLFDDANFTPLMQMTGELLQVGLELVDEKTDDYTQSRISQYVNIGNNVFQVYDGIRRKNYSNVFVHVNSIVKIIAEDYTQNNFTFSRKFLDEAIANYPAYATAINDKKPSDSVVKSIVNEILTKLNSSITSEELQPKLSVIMTDNLIKSLTSFYSTAANSTRDTLLNALLTKGTITTAISGTIVSGTLANGIIISGTLSDLTITTATNGTLISGKLTRSGPDNRWKINELDALNTLAGRYLFSDHITRFIRNTDKWVSFASGVVSATTTEQVRDVIKNYVDPPTSYIDKRINPITLSVGGMPGLFVGLEHYDTQSTGSKFAFGLSLPVGLDLSFALSHKKRLGRQKNAFSFGLFAQFVDLGAMLRYRIETEADNIPNSITIRQLFSPGGFLTLGLPNSPVTLGAGYQYAPQLNVINTNGNDDIRQNAHRWSIRISYDIPLFRIFGSKRSYDL